MRWLCLVLSLLWQYPLSNTHTHTQQRKTHSNSASATGHIWNIFFPTKTDFVRPEVFRALLHVVAVSQARERGATSSDRSLRLPTFEGVAFPVPASVTGGGVSGVGGGIGGGDNDNNDDDDDDFGDFEGAGEPENAVSNDKAGAFGDFKVAMPRGGAGQAAADLSASFASFASTAPPAATAALATPGTPARPSGSHSAHSSFGDFVSATPAGTGIVNASSFSSSQVPAHSAHSSFGDFISAAPPSTSSSPTKGSAGPVANANSRKGGSTIDLSMLYGTTPAAESAVPSAPPSSSSSSTLAPTLPAASSSLLAPVATLPTPPRSGPVDLFSSYEQRYVEALFFGAMERKMTEGASLSSTLLRLFVIHTKTYRAPQTTLWKSVACPQSTRKRCIAV